MFNNRLPIYINVEDQENPGSLVEGILLNDRDIQENQWLDRKAW